jgi:hypothetical protein
MDSGRRVSFSNVMLLVLAMCGPVFIYHVTVLRFLVHHLVIESKKGDPDRWFAQNPDLVKIMADKYGITLHGNAAIPGSIWVGGRVETKDVPKARAGLAFLREELFKRRCPYGITLVSFDLDNPKVGGP